MNSESIEVKLSQEEAGGSELTDSRGRFDFEKFFEENKLQVILGLSGLFLLLVGIFSAVALSLKEQGSDGVEIISVSDEEKEGKEEILVDVSGAVQSPGLYKLDSDARINDALIVAGGLSAEADRDWFQKTVNLAQRLKDGVKIYIPFQGETSSQQIGTGEVAGEQTSVFVNKGKIDLNSASSSELETLSGIGPAYAQKIIQARPFSSIEDILKISGIGEKTFQKIKDQITVF